MADRLDDATTAATRRGAAIVAERAESLAPRRSGALAGSVRVVDVDDATSTVVAGGDDVPYGRVIHDGWPRRNIVGQPFLTDALDERRDDVVNVYRDKVDELIRRFDVEA